MMRMFFSVDKSLLSLARRARRRGLSIFSLTLRPGVAGVFLFTTLFGPASGWGQSRASQMLAGVQHDEFSSAAEDGGHFSPERLRARILSLDMMVAAHNARFARLQGRPFAGGAGDDVAPRVFQAALEKFQTAAQMNADVEMRRARFSQKFAAAGGFQYRTFADGKRMWFKNGRVSRIENEKIVDAFGNTHRQDTTEMVYDKRGNLLSSKTETRDANGHMTVKRWQGTYNNVPGRDRLVSFSESTWDPLGNESRLDRTDLVWDAEGKNLLSYEEKATDPYGTVSTRRVWDSKHDKDGNLLSFKEESESKGVKGFREWFGATYKSAGKKKGKDEWQLTSYQEKTTDALGRETTREWGEAQYDDKGALRAYTEKTTGPDGETTVKTWGDAEFDRNGNLAFFRETLKSSSGRETTRVFRNGKYDDHGRVLSYEELTSETDGPSALRVWSGGRYNERNELLSYTEKITDSHGVPTTREWRATTYVKGQPSATIETVTDDQGHATTREWNGRFGGHGRLVGFDEKTTDARGNVSTVTQNSLTYDALGRLIGYDERSSDIFGRPTVSTWRATAFDVKDRAIATVRTDQGEDGRVRRAERSNIAYDAVGRVASYEESLSARGGSQSDATGRQTWTALGYDRHGDLLGFELTSTNARGETETQRRTTTYDNRGRVVGMIDVYVNPLGETQTVDWNALRFDAWGNVDKYTETIAAAGQEKTRVWEGTLDSRGLASDSRETITDASGFQVTHQLREARYDARGRMTDGVRATQRSDYPDVSIVSTTAGKAYDAAGQTIGGTETTRIQGRAGGETINLTTVEINFGGTFVEGRATQTRSTVETTGTWGPRQVHTRDTVESLFGSMGERTDNRTSQAFDAAGALIKDNRTTTTRTNLEVDLAGRTLAYEESSADAAAPKARTTTRRVNHYYGNGELSGYAEETTNAFGVTTRVSATDLATDALGQTVQSREKSTQPGFSVKTDETFKTNMRYDLLGRNIGGGESSSTTGSGLSTRASSAWRTVFDGAGRVIESTSAGERDGVSFENTTRNSAFDIHGRAIDYRSVSEGAAGVSDVETTGVQFDEFGRAYKRHEDGWNSGSYSNAEVTAGYDALGREVKTAREGYNGQGDFREETTTQGFNALGQAMGRSTSGWNATEGNYSYEDTGLNYGLTGELLSFDRAKLNGDKKDVSHWASKGVDAAGRSLGFTEVGKSFENGKFINDFTIDHATRAHNGNGQEVAYRHVTTKTYVGGTVETTVSEWKGAYDDKGRQVELRDEQTITLTENGVTKEATLSRWREGISYYDTDGDGHRQGMMRGYDETVFDSATPDKGQKTTVRNMRYDAAGRYLDGETATGEVSRLKDALRRIADVFSGSNLAQTGRNLLAGLERLVANTAQLSADVAAWLKENIAAPGKGFVDSIVRWLGAPGEAPPALSATDVEKLVRAVSEKAGGVVESDVPLGLVPAAKTMGVFDQGLAVTRTKAKAFDALGRAVSWVEETRSMAAPEKPVQSEIRVTYEGESSRLASYAARVVDGEKVNQIFRDKYSYDALGRSTYREVRFEGDGLDELLEAAPSAAGRNPPTRALEWAGLSADRRSALVDRLVDDTVQILGRVEIDLNEAFDYDAKGAVVSRRGERFVRGNVFTELGLEKVLPKSIGQAAEESRKAIQEEIASLIAKQETILTGAMDALTQAEKDAANAKETLFRLENGIGPLEKELESKEEMARDALAAKEAIVAQIIAVYGPDYATREEIDRPGQSKAEKEWSEWQSRLAKTEETYVAALKEVAKAHDALEKGREGKNNLEAAFEANLASANEAKEAATAARDAAQKAVNALLGTDLFLSLAGEKKGDLPANYTTDSRGRRVDVEEGAKATVVNQRWYAVVRVRADGRVVRTYVRRDLEKSYVFKKESKADEGKWVEVAQREVPEMEDPEPAFLPRSTSLLWAQNLKGEKTLATIPTGQGQGAETFLASLEEALASLRTHFAHNNFKKLFPNNRISLGEQLLTDKPGPLVVNQAKAQPALQSILNKLSTLIDTTQKLDVASQIAGAAKDTLDIHNKKVTEIKESLLGLDEAVAISRKDLDRTSKDVEIEKARLEAEETRQLSEATDELAAQKTEWTKELAGAEVWINGAVASLPAGFWDTLLEKGEASLNGRPQTLAGLSAVARVRTRLADRERFARLDENRPDGISISWRGALSPGAAATFDGLRRAAQSALSAGSDDDRRAAFGLATDGRLTVSRVGAQTQDAAGRALAQSIDTLEISRQGGDTAVRRTTQSTQGFKYDARGQVIAYERTTHEAGKPDVVERLVGATYDAAGRLIKSDVRLRDPSSGYTGEIQLLTENFSFGADGAPRHSLRTQIKDGQVSAVEDLGLSRTDALGRVVFSLTNNLTTSLDSWKASGGDYAAAPGDRSTTALLNRSFNARGEATSTLRMTSKTGANGAWHTSFESSATAFSPGGQVIASTVKTVEAGRDGASVLFRSTIDRILDVKYDEQGRALRQRTARTENGQTRETWDELDRKYDAFGRLVETHTKTRDALGEITEAFWSGVYGADGRLSAYSQWNIANGQKIEERSVGAPVVDAQGRTIFPTSEVTEWNSDGTESITRSKTESGAVYNLFGQLVSQEITTKSPLSDGAFSTETKSYTYGYDTAGRQTKTWVDGREEAGGKVRQFNSYNEVLAFDAAGRSRRALSRSTQGALVTERVSLEDIRYDSKGRLIGSRDRVHRSGVDPVTGAELDAYTTEISETQKFDAWNRATDYTQTTLAGALKTVSIVQATYGRDGRVTDQSTTYDEYSLAAGVDHRVHRVVQQTGMTYDGVGNLVDYQKTVTEGDLVSTYTPAALEYDEFGRSVTALERVRDNAGRDEIVGALGTQFNGLGQVVGGQTVTIKGGSALLGDKGLLAKVTERLLAGDLANGQGTQLVADTGLEGLWSTRLLGAAYDAQGRQLYSDSVTDKAGHGFKDVVVDLVLAKGWVGKGTGWWYGQQFANALAKLKAEGAEIVYSKFFHGGGVHRRYCKSLISYRKKEAAIQESHERTENAVNVFDPFGRALAQTVTAHRGDNTTTTDQWLAYDANGRVAMIMNNVFENGLNGDGTRFARAFSQSQEFSYDALGRSTSEKTVTWADSQAPYKITTSTTDNISYDKGQRVGWKETTQSNDRTAVDERVITGAGYDGLGRLASYDATVYEVNNGVRKLQYKDLNVRNSYDALGRLTLTLSDRVWGTTESVRVATRKREKGLLVTGFATVQKAVEEGAGGGGIAGLSEDWTTGRAAVAITYEYSNGGSSLSGMRVRAFGTGTHKEKTVQAAGIRLDHYQKNMRYDSVGRVTGYKLISTQVERYQYYKQGQSGLRRKVKSAWTTGAVTTVSDVEVKEYDGFGRQVHTVVTSQRNDINKTWTRTETIVKSFDDQGRAKDVKRTTDSKMTLPKSSGGLLGGLGGVALGVLLAVSLVGLVVGVIATVASIATGAVVGMGALSANWLGGQRIYSHNVVEQTMAYKVDGTIDEAKTKAQTRTLEEKSYMMGQNFGDKLMMATDIVVAVAAVVTTVMTAGAATGFWAAVGASLFNLAPTLAYQAARQGISINDFEAHPDRENARNSRMMVVNYVGQSLLAGFGSSLLLSQANTAAQAAISKGATFSEASQIWVNASKGLTEVNRAYFALASFGYNMLSAAAGGATGKTLLTVGAISAANGLLGGYNVSNGGGNAWLAGSGEFIRQAGMTYGKANQRTTWMLVGTGVSSASGGTAQVIGTVGKSFALNLYSKNNDGGTDRERYQRGFVLQFLGELAGTLTNIGVDGFKRYFSTNASQGTIRNFFGALVAGIAAPFATIGKIPGMIARVFEASSSLKTIVADAIASAPVEWGERFKGLEATLEPGYFRVQPGETFEWGGKKWEAESVFAATDRGLVVVSGISREARIDGISWGDGLSIPIYYERSAEGVLIAKLIDFSALPSLTKVDVQKEVRVWIRWGDGQPPVEIEVKRGALSLGQQGVLTSLDHQTMFRSAGDPSWKIYLQSTKTSAPQIWEMVFDRDDFKIENPRFVFSDKTRVEINAVIRGSLAGGTVLFENLKIPADRLLLRGGKNVSEGLSGPNSGALVVSSDGGVTFNRARFKGRSRVEGLEAFLSPRTAAATEREGEVGPKPMMLRNEVKVLKYDRAANTALIDGEFIVNTDQSGDRKLGFGIGTRYLLADGVVIKTPQMTLRQNGSPNASELTLSGMVFGEGMSAKLAGQSEEWIFGKGGEVEVRVLRVRVGDHVERRVLMAGSETPVNAAMVEGRLRIDAVGGRTLWLDVPQEQRGDRTARWHGSLTAKDWQWNAEVGAKVERVMNRFSLSGFLKDVLRMDLRSLTLGSLTQKAFGVDTKKASVVGMIDALQVGGEDVLALKEMATKVGAFGLRTAAHVAAGLDALMVADLWKSQGRVDRWLVKTDVGRQELFARWGNKADARLARGEALKAEMARARVWKATDGGGWGEVELPVGKMALANLAADFLTLGGARPIEDLHAEHGTGGRGLFGFIQNQSAGMLAMFKPRMMARDRASELAGEGGRWRAGAERVAWAETSVNLAGMSIIVLGTGAAVVQKGRMGFAETRTATKSGFARLAMGKRVLNAAFEATREFSKQGMENALPGLHIRKLADTLELRRFEFQRLENIAISKTLGLTGDDGIVVVGRARDGNMVAIQVMGDGAQSPLLRERLTRIGQRAAAEGWRVDVGVMLDEVGFNVLAQQDWFVNAQSERGLRNIEMHGVDLRERARGAYREAVSERLEQRAMAKEYRLERQRAERELAPSLKAEKAAKDLLAKAKEVSTDELVRQTAELVGGKEGRRLLEGWERERGYSADRQNPGDFEGSRPGRREGGKDLRQPGESIPEADGGVRRIAPESESAWRKSKGLGEAIKREKLATEREKLATELLTKEIGRLGSKNEHLVKRIAGLREAESLATGRAEVAGRGVRSLKREIADYDRALVKLRDRIERMAPDRKGRPPRVATEPLVTLTSQMDLGEADMGWLIRRWGNSGHGLDAVYAPTPFPSIAEGNFFDSVSGDGVVLGEMDRGYANGRSPPRGVVLVSVRENLDVARSVARKIDPRRLRGEGNRFHQAVYFAEDLLTGLMEVLGKKSRPTHAAQYELNLAKARTLDLTNPEIAKAWNYTPDLWKGLSSQDVYLKTHEIHHAARMAGYDVIAYESVKNPGHTNYAVIDNFKKLLTPAKESLRALDSALIKEAQLNLDASLSPYRAGKEAMASQRGAILVPTSGEVRGPFRSLWNRLLGRKETLANAPTNGPPVARASGDNIDVPMGETVVRRDLSVPIHPRESENTMGFQNGRPMSADNPNFQRSPRNQFKDFLDGIPGNGNETIKNTIVESPQSSLGIRGPTVGQLSNLADRLKLRIRNEGAMLPDREVMNFVGLPERVLVKEGEVLYGIRDPGSRSLWWTRQEPMGKLQWRMDQAVLEKWNSATHVERLIIPRGESLIGFEGPARNQKGYLGGGNQIYITDVPETWRTKTEWK